MAAGTCLTSFLTLDSVCYYPGEFMVLPSNDVVPLRRSSGDSLSTEIFRQLKQQIEQGEFLVGEKLPSEARLTERFGVSRTVVREAVAALRAEGLAISQQGAGVFVQAPKVSVAESFQPADPTKTYTVIELMELRTAVEVEAAGLAAARLTPENDDLIHQALNGLTTDFHEGRNIAKSDFNLHMVVANCTGNSRFPKFLELVEREMTPFKKHHAIRTNQSLVFIEEHTAIVNAISARDPQAARDAMRTHLERSQIRYRDLLREALA